MEIQEPGYRVEPAPPRGRRPAITPARMALLAGALLAALVAGLIAEAGGPMLARLDNFLRDRHQREFMDARNRFEAARKAEDHPAALRELDRMMRATRNHPNLMMLRASLLSDMGRHEEAVEDLDRVVRAFPNDATALNNRAYFKALARKDLEGAKRDIDAALVLQPDQATFRDTKAYLLYLEGDHQAALKLYDGILDDADARAQMADKDVGEIQYHRGLARKAVGMRQAAEEDFAAARRLGFKVAAVAPGK